MSLTQNSLLQVLLLRVFMLRAHLCRRHEWKQTEHKSPKDIEYNANIEGRAATQYYATIHVFVFHHLSTEGQQVRNRPLLFRCSRSRKHLIPQVHFRRAYQGIHSAVFPSDVRQNCAISASISNSISQAAQRFWREQLVSRAEFWLLC